MDNKSYNPFKMWGSWIGLIIVFFGAVWFGISLDNLWGRDLNLLQFFNPQMLVFYIPGFLIGYAIHALFRRFSNG